MARLGERRDALRRGDGRDERAAGERHRGCRANERSGPHHSGCLGVPGVGAKTARAVSFAVIVTDIDPNARFPVPLTDTTCLPGVARNTNGALPRRMPLM